MPWRPTWAEVDLSAFRANLRAWARCVPSPTRFLAVLKANGYGHGAAPLAREARAQWGERLWGFGVSSVEEGVALREAGLRDRILILGSLYPFESFKEALAHRLTPTIASRAAALALPRGRRPFPFHVKIDTGMGRIGMSPRTAREVLASLLQDPSRQLEGVYTHLACADRPSVVKEQLRRFSEAIQDFRPLGGDDLTPRKISPLFHVAHTAGAISYPETRLDLVRPGLGLYGLYPWPALQKQITLKPLLQWKTRVVFVKTVNKGTPVSYGWTWRARRTSRLATLPVGYADGYRREFSNKAQVLLGGRRCPVVGRVTMDQIIVDVTNVPHVHVGAEVCLVGAQGRERITVDDLAHWAGTLSYEIVCGLSARVPRVYVNQQSRGER